MGAQSFTNLVVSKGKMSDAFFEARREMNEYNGHQDGYSGDIQTADGFSKCNSKLPFFQTKSFYNKIEEMTADMSKGDCKAIELKGTALAIAKKELGYFGKRGYKAYFFFGLARV